MNDSQLILARDVYRHLYDQYAQLLDATVRIAGPAANTVGGTPAFPDFISTYSFCPDNATSNSTTNSLVGAATLGSKPSESTDKWKSPLAGDTNVAFWSERRICGPITVRGQEFCSIPNLFSTVSGAFWNGTGNDHFINHIQTTLGWFQRSLDVKFELNVGYGAGAKSAVTNWAVFVTTIALPLLATYQAVLKNIGDRIRATVITDPALRAEMWSLLMSCSTEVTEFTLGKLEVLRDPVGNPIYLPPASVSVVRDELMASVITAHDLLDASAYFAEA